MPPPREGRPDGVGAETVERRPDLLQGRSDGRAGDHAYLPAQQRRNAAGQLGLIIPHDPAVGKSHLDRRCRRVGPGWRHEARLALEQRSVTLGTLGAGHPPRLYVQKTVGTVADHTCGAEQNFPDLFAPHGFDGIVPQSADRCACHPLILRAACSAVNDTVAPGTRAFPRRRRCRASRTSRSRPRRNR